MNNKNQQKDNNKQVSINEGYKPSKDMIKHGYNPDKNQNTNSKPTSPPVKP